jgi:hypothetical protein
MDENLETYTTESGAITLAVAVDLVSCIMREIAGYHISNTINGENINDKIITDLAMASFQENLKKNKGV